MQCSMPLGLLRSWKVGMMVMGSSSAQNSSCGGAAPGGCGRVGRGFKRWRRRVPAPSRSPAPRRGAAPRPNRASHLLRRHGELELAAGHRHRGARRAAAPARAPVRARVRGAGAARRAPVPGPAVSLDCCLRSSPTPRGGPSRAGEVGGGLCGLKNPRPGLWQPEGSANCLAAAATICARARPGRPRSREGAGVGGWPFQGGFGAMGVLNGKCVTQTKPTQPCRTPRPVETMLARARTHASAAPSGRIGAAPMRVHPRGRAHPRCRSSVGARQPRRRRR
jgi:hypothetical protein